MKRIDLEITPVQRAVRIVMVNLALALRILGTLDGKSQAAICPKTLPPAKNSILTINPKAHLHFLVDKEGA